MGKANTTIKKFESTCVKDSTKKCWSDQGELIFKDVADLAVTSFPQSAIDCGIECQCGIEKPRSQRIIGGGVSEV